MADNFTVRDASGAVVTRASKDIGAGVEAMSTVRIDASGNVAPSQDAAARAAYVIVTNGTQNLPTGDAVARGIYVRPTDGTNSMPSMDAVARSGFQQITDATTGPVAVKAASTPAAATDKALVVSLSPNSPVTTNAEASSAATAATKCILEAAVFLAYGSLPAGTTGQQVAMQCDPAGTQKVGVVPLGTILTDSHTGAATATTCTLAKTAAKMSYLAGFAVTGLGATSAASIQITTTGLAANLTFTLPIPAGVTAAVTPLIVTFNPPLPASAVNVDIVISVPSFGSGNTVASASAWGFQI